jgi:hypothetical protein
LVYSNNRNIIGGIKMDIFSDILHVFSGFDKYLLEAYQKVSSIFTVAMVGINYVLFPDKAYIPAAIALGGAMICDILTKYYALQKTNGGLVNAIKIGVIKSAKFWEGTKKKLISTFIIMILCGLSVRVAPVASIAVLLSTVAYSIMFLRESQSCVENLIEAGHTDLTWFLFFLKKKQTTVLEGATSEYSSSSDDGKGNTSSDSKKNTDDGKGNTTENSSSSTSTNDGQGNTSESSTTTKSSESTI